MEINLNFKNLPDNNKKFQINDTLMKNLAKVLKDSVNAADISPCSKTSLTSALDKVIISNRVLGMGQITSGLTITREILELVLFSIFNERSDKGKRIYDVSVIKTEIFNNQEEIFGAEVFKRIPGISENANTLQEMYNWLSEISHPSELKLLYLEIEKNIIVSRKIGKLYRNSNILVLSAIAGYLNATRLITVEDAKKHYAILKLINITHLELTRYLLNFNEVVAFLRKIDKLSNSTNKLSKYIKRKNDTKDALSDEINRAYEELEMTDEEKQIVVNSLNETLLGNKDLLLEELEILYEDGFLNKEAYSFLKKQIHGSKLFNY